MLGNYFRIAVRFFYRNKGFTLINIVGLAMGIACAVLIFLYVYDEMRYDRHHEKSDRIFLVCREGRWEGNDYKSGWTTPPMAQAMKEDYPEIESYVRMALWYSEHIFEYGESMFPEKFVVVADSTVFDIFTIPFLHGDPKTALSRPRTMVITESTARKYFGEKDALGKVLKLADRDREFEITGVVADQPKQSHFYFDVMYSLSTYGDYATAKSWFNHTFMSYILLEEGQDPAELEAKFDDFIFRYLDPYIQDQSGITLQEFFDQGNKYQFWLMPLKDVHLSKMITDAQGTKAFIYILSLVGGIIILIASINYMNLSTAMAATRSREVGIRKVVGASRRGLIQQFLVESFLLSFVAFCLGMLLVELIIPQFNEFTEKSIKINYFSNALIVPAMILFMVILSILSGFYPAVLLSRFRPVLVLKGLLSERVSRGGYWLRNILVLFQFTICIVFLIGTMVVNRQLKFMQDKDLGFDNEQVLVLHRSEGLGESHGVFKEQLLAIPGIQHVSYSYNTPARHHNEQGHHVKGDPQHISPSLFVAWGDFDYIKTMGLQLVEGRDFDESKSTDRFTAILNESAARKLARPDSSSIVFDQVPGPAVDSIDYTVIGIVRDFHFAHLDQEIRSWILLPLREDIMNYSEYVNIKLNTSKLVNTINAIEDLWNEHSGNFPFEYSFLDDDFELLFKKEMRARKMFGWFSTFAIIIACLGLLGLAAFTANQKTKQIGIRKAMGSSSLQVQILLSKQFSKWILLASLIAWPVAWYMINKWLQGYAFRIDIPYWIFLLATLAALLIALLTVSYHSWKVSSRNPSDSLRYE